jgi:stage V sporulation protein B
LSEPRQQAPGVPADDVYRPPAARASAIAPESASDQQIRDAGRGGLALTAAKLYFLALGLVQQIALSWLLKDGYGALRGALSPASITYNPLVAAGVQGMSRAVAQAQHAGPQSSLRGPLLVHAACGALAGGGFFLLAPLLGEWLNSHYLVPAFRWLGLGIFGYGIYAPLVGVLNGQRRFLLQAALDSIAATARTIALLAGGYLFLSRGTPAAVAGASMAFALVTLLMFALTLLLARPRMRGGSVPSWKGHLFFVGPVIFAQLLLNLLLQADTNTLRAFATRAAEQSGQEAQAADALVAAYNAAQLFGFLPYQVLMGITFIVFPMLARAHASSDRAAVRAVTRGGLRIALIVTGALVGMTSGLAPNLMRVVFPPSFAELGGDSMKLLCLGLGGFALFGMTTTVLNSLGRQWQSLLITALALGAVVGFNFLFVQPLPFGPELLDRTALATSLGILIGLVLSVLEVQRAVGAVVASASVLRVVAAVAACVALGRLLPDLSRIPTLLACVASLGLYVGLLAALRELDAADLAAIKAITRRR